MSAHEIARIVLAGVVALGFFALIGLTLFVPIQSYELQIVDMLIGAMVASFTSVISFFFRG